MSNFSGAIQEYRIPNGMVSLGKGDTGRSCDNHIYFTAIYNLLLKQQPDAPKAEFFDADFFFYVAVGWCAKEPGLIMRYPGDYEGEQQHDDLRAIAAVDITHTKDILNYGRKNSFCWNTKNPGVYDQRFCFDRFPGFMAVLMAGAGESVPLAEQFSFFLSCFGILLDKRKTSPIILQWVSIKAVEGKHWFMDLGILIWRFIAMRKYPKGLKEVMEIYFKPEHPFAQYARTDFS